MTHEHQAALARLDDYVRGHHDEQFARDYEQELFSRALRGQAPELDFRAALNATLRTMQTRGTLDLWLTQREVAQVRASNLRTFLYEYDPANPTLPEIPPDTDLLITRIPVDLSGVQSLEAEIVGDDGRSLKRMPDVRFDPEDGAIYACCEADLARTAAGAQRPTRLWAVDDSGRRLLAELPAF